MIVINKINIDSTAIVPLVNEGKIQFIFQRHCMYDKVNGILIDDSINKQKGVVNRFVDNLNVDELRKTFFLFTSSNTISSLDFKRCVETTNIAMESIKEFLKKNDIPVHNIINYNEDSNYNYTIHEDNLLTEPKMFTDSTGYFEYLKKKHDGINSEFWIDFEEDISKEKRKSLNAEGPDEIVNRAVKYIKALQKYAYYFRIKHPSSKLIIWNGTHYDLISPLVKQKILGWEKSSEVNVDYCGGISLILDEKNNIIANVNGNNYYFDSQYSSQLHRHF